MKRENIFSTRPALGPSFVGEAVLDETREGVVEAVREGERSAAFAVRGATAGADVVEETAPASSRPAFP